jgi:lipid-A-disaccharide synthase
VKRLSFMLVAGEPSGDTLAAELVQALRAEASRFQARPTPDLQPLFTSLEPKFFGAGGPKMAAAGVKLDVDMTAHAVFGLVEVVKKLGEFHRLRRQLKLLAIRAQPDALICVDYAGFNRRLAHAVKDHVRASRGTFRGWNPRIIQFISPQVWASRPGRADAMAKDFDLVLSIFPFEKAWYAERVPQLKVEFVGHPMLDRYPRPEARSQQSAVNTVSSQAAPSSILPPPSSPKIVLLPGSRIGELRRHLPVLLDAAKRIHRVRSAGWRMVLPDERLAETARPLLPSEPRIEVQVGGLAEALSQASLALASSGTVTMECAFFGVPAVVLYKISWPEFELARRLATVKHVAMPNLLASKMVYPEFLQQAATGQNVARAALGILSDPARAAAIKESLGEAIASLGPPGATRRAARAILGALGESVGPSRLSGTSEWQGLL